MKNEPQTVKHSKRCSTWKIAFLVDGLELFNLLTSPSPDVPIPCYVLMLLTHVYNDQYSERKTNHWGAR